LDGPAQQDEVLLDFDTPEGAIASTVWFGAGSLVESLAAQELDLAEAGKGDQLSGNRSALVLRPETLGPEYLPISAGERVGPNTPWNQFGQILNREGVSCLFDPYR
jgi:hypothetical protein